MQTRTAPAWRALASPLPGARSRAPGAPGLPAALPSMGLPVGRAEGAGAAAPTPGAAPPAAQPGAARPLARRPARPRRLRGVTALLLPRRRARFPPRLCHSAWTPVSSPL